MMTAMPKPFAGLRRLARAVATRARAVAALVGQGAVGNRGDAAASASTASPRRELTPAALRALAEAEARRAAAAEAAKNAPKPPVEHGGRKGPDPTRYGDWENNGIASDF